MRDGARRGGGTLVVRRSQVHAGRTWIVFGAVQSGPGGAAGNIGRASHGVLTAAKRSHRDSLEDRLHHCVLLQRFGQISTLR